ncbi:MAG: glycosidase, partial [Rhodothermales bacterium]
MSLFTKSPYPVLEPMPDIPWADGAVFNPAAWYDGKTVHLLFRAVPAGYRRIRLEHAVDGEPNEGFSNYTSYIGYASSADGLHFTVRAEPFIAPDSLFDRFGAEDPRVSRLDGRYFVTYSALQSDAFSPDAIVRVALASTVDFERVEKHGVVGPPERDKDAVIFPATFGGRVAMLHRIVPDIQLIYFDDVDQLCRPPAGIWDDHMANLERHVIMRPEQEWEEKKIGAGPTP